MLYDYYFDKFYYVFFINLCKEKYCKNLNYEYFVSISESAVVY